MLRTAAQPLDRSASSPLSRAQAPAGHNDAPRATGYSNRLSDSDPVDTFTPVTLKDAPSLETVTLSSTPSEPTTVNIEKKSATWRTHSLFEEKGKDDKPFSVPSNPTNLFHTGMSLLHQNSNPGLAKTHAVLSWLS